MSNVLSEFGNLVGIADNPNKADKVPSAVENNLTVFDANGNIKDSGAKPADFEPALTLTETTLTGNPIVVDGKKLAVSTKITFDPIQAGSGDPSPSNVRAISGYKKVELAVPRKNLCSIGSISGTRNANKIILPLPAGTYTFSALVTSSDTDASKSRVILSDAAGTENIVVFDMTRNVRSSYTFTLSKKAERIYFYASTDYNQSAGDTFSFDDIQIELGSTATTYEPYNPITDISNPLPETLYGGTLDVETGELTITHRIVDMGNLEWTKTDTTSSFYYGVYVSDKKNGATNIIADSFSVDNRPTDSMNNGTMKGAANDTRIMVKWTDYSTASAFTTAVTGKKLVYELATPYTLKLTPAQVRLLTTQSVVTSNGSTIELEVSNAKVASIEAVDSVKESVDKLGEYITANHIGDSVNLTSYSSANNKFKFPYDGYVMINGRNNTSGYIRVYLFAESSTSVISAMSVNITGVQQMQSIFVRKGMSCYIATDIADLTSIVASYAPLI